MTDSAFREGRESGLETVMRSQEDTLFPSRPHGASAERDRLAVIGRAAEESQLLSEDEGRSREV